MFRKMDKQDELHKTLCNLRQMASVDDYIDVLLRSVHKIDGRTGRSMVFHLAMG